MALMSLALGRVMVAVLEMLPVDCKLCWADAVLDTKSATDVVEA